MFKTIARITTTASAISLMATVCAIASVATFTDTGGFGAATTITETDTFSDLPGFLMPETLTRGSATYISTNSSGLFNTTGFTLPGTYLASQNSGGGIQINLAPGFTAFGLELGTLLRNGTVDFTVNGSSGPIASGAFGTSMTAFNFLGFVSDSEEITSIVLIGDNSLGETFEAIDNVQIGNAVAPVPLPAGMVLILGATAALGGLRARRRAKG